MPRCPVCTRETTHGVVHDCPPAWEARLETWDDATASRTVCAADVEGAAAALVDACLLTYDLMEQRFAYGVRVRLRQHRQTQWHVVPAMVEPAGVYDATEIDQPQSVIVTPDCVIEIGRVCDRIEA
jgi:hypothetical protein